MIHLCTAWFDSRGGAARLIDSVLRQTHSDFLWQVSVDPKSPDVEGLALLRIAAAADPRIIVKVQEVSTAPYIGAAKDDAFRMVLACHEPAEWCAWIDADDWLDLDALATLDFFAHNTDKAWMITWVWEEFAGKTDGPRMTHPRMNLAMLMAQPAGLPHMEAFRIECLREEPYDRELAAAEDWDLHIRFWKRHGPPLFVPKAVYHYRMGVGRYDRDLVLKSIERIRAKHAAPTRIEIAVDERRREE